MDEGLHRRRLGLHWGYNEVRARRVRDERRDSFGLFLGVILLDARVIAPDYDTRIVEVILLNDLFCKRGCVSIAKGLRTVTMAQCTGTAAIVPCKQLLAPPYLANSPRNDHVLRVDYVVRLA